MGFNVIRSACLLIMVDFPRFNDRSTKYGISANKDLRKKQPNNLKKKQFKFTENPTFNILTFWKTFFPKAICSSQHVI